MADDKKRPVIDKDSCTGCGICVDECPHNIFKVVDGIAEISRSEDCDGCGNCEEACPNEAIKIQ